MARDTSPQCKQCRREGQKLFLKGERCLTDKCGVERRSYPPGEHGRGRQKQSECRLQLREKQKARRYYGVLEKQFRTYYDKASRQPGITGENLLRILECRFDNVLVRLGFAASRRQARSRQPTGHAVEFTPSRLTPRRMNGITVVVSRWPPASPTAAMFPSGWVVAHSHGSTSPPTLSIAPAHRAVSSGRTFEGTSDDGRISVAPRPCR